MKPLLSIVCPARNAADTIPSLVASLGPRDDRAELVLCDDASTDGTAQAALDAAKDTGFRVRVLRNADRRDLLRAVLAALLLQLAATAFAVASIFA